MAGTNVNADNAISNTLLVNRQPIFDARMCAVGYESKSHVRTIGATSQDGAPADDSAVLDLFLGNLDLLAGDHWALVTLPRQTIMAAGYETLPRDRVVIGVEDGYVDDDLLKCLGKLCARGYRLAIDGGSRGLWPIAERAHILKFNFADVYPQSATYGCASFRMDNAKTLISGVDTPQAFEWAAKNEFDLFAGRFLYTPNVQAQSVPITRSTTLRLLAALQNPEIRLPDLENIIRFDVSLSYKLLGFVNSALVSLNREVTSIQHAISLVGLDTIRQWASLLIFSSITEKPRELLITAAIRARMCEQLAGNDPRRDEFFTVGLFSVLDALIDRSMGEAVQGLGLSQEMCDALVYKSGRLGMTLWAVIAYEQGEWNRHALQRFRPRNLRQSYLDSLNWSHTVTRGLMI